ncbi:hypothetical protein X975_08987, partial [Stegodyphus mimosarum]
MLFLTLFVSLHFVNILIVSFRCLRFVFVLIFKDGDFQTGFLTCKLLHFSSELNDSSVQLSILLVSTKIISYALILFGCLEMRFPGLSVRQFCSLFFNANPTI